MSPAIWAGSIFSGPGLLALLLVGHYERIRSYEAFCSAYATYSS
jgi:hypothetical protein